MIIKRNKFIDSTIINITSGNGGNGHVSFRKEKFVPKGGPDGGNGGNGGNITLLCDPNIIGLGELNFIKRFKAKHGENGKNKNRSGKNAEDLILRVPKGTLVWVQKNKKYIFIGELLEKDDNLILAKGGKGGNGNKKFVEASNQEPLLAEAGEKGKCLNIKLELRIIADVGLVGSPNVGKSSVVKVLTNAKPKVADYPFTTLEPVIGVIKNQWDTITIAEIPGIIDQASEGKGLGHEFLKHIKRVNLIVHLLDASRNKLFEDFEKINNELMLFDKNLLKIKKLIVINKIDLLENLNDINKIKSKFEEDGWDVLTISAIKMEGIEDLKITLIKATENFSISKIQIKKHLNSTKQERLKLEDNKVIILDQEIVQIAEGTDLSNPNAQIQFYREMKKKGISRLLEEAGVKRGDKVWLNEIEMEMR
ncbi:MAG: GTPase CgtA [Chloroflexi bacterium]|nr:GTPase CgtA [Chloroflexota bacterium]|tara:strand:- start:8918 stop:10183 length:1266 start_codon:yes stop_codon:yes gene_type:complete